MPNVAGRFTCRFGHFPDGPLKFRLGDSECKQEFSRGVADKTKTTNFKRKSVGSPAPNPTFNLKGQVPGELTNLRFEEPLLKWTGELAPIITFLEGDQITISGRRAVVTPVTEGNEVPVKIKLDLPVVGTAQERRGGQAGPATAGSRAASREKTDWSSKDRIRSVRLSNATALRALSCLQLKRP